MVTKKTQGVSFNLFVLARKFSNFHCTKMKCLIKDLFSECDQICSFLQIRSHILKKYFMENFIFCVVFAPKASSAFGNFPNFLAIDSQQLSDVLGKWLKFHTNVQQGLKKLLNVFLDLSLYWVTITFFFGSSSIPVDTRRRFNVDTTSCDIIRRCIDVEMTSCVYWGKLYILDVIIVFEIN